MKEIRLREDGRILTELQFRNMLGTIPLPINLDKDILSEHGADPILQAPVPEIDELHYAIRAYPVQDAQGNWVQGYEIVSKFTEYTDDNNVVHTVVEQETEYLQKVQQDKINALQQAIILATQARLDSFAKTKGYDSILSAATYASSIVPEFAVEGQIAVNSRDVTWAKLYQILAEVQQGVRVMPGSFLDIESELPVLVWSA